MPFALAQRDIREDLNLHADTGLTECKSKHSNDITILNTVASLVRQSCNLDKALADAFHKMLDLMRLDGGALFLLDKHREELRLIIHHGLPTEAIQNIGRVKLGDNTIGHVAVEGKPIVVTNLSKDFESNPHVLGATEGFTFFASVPMKLKDKVLGVMSVLANRYRQLTTADITLLTSIGSWIATLIENNKSNLSINKQLQHINARHPVDTAADKNSKIVELLHQIAKKATNSLNGQGALITLKDPYNEEICAITTYGKVEQMQELTIDVDHKLSEWIIDNRRPLICPNVRNNSYIDETIRNRITVQSIIGVPIIVENEPIGAILVFDKLHKFNDHDADLLTALATQAAMSIGKNKVTDKLKHKFNDFIWKSPKMKSIFQEIEKLLDIDIPVLIEGESGTGKELVAKAIHYQGQRRKGPFLAVNCGALPETLLEAELFGHKKGSFTDANEDRQGIFEAASHGTVFLDEVSEMSPALQAKLLRVLQEHEITRIGEHKPRKVDVRVISATNKNLEKLVDEGKFREDLFYRLNVVRIYLPPLRERKEDILPLAHYFLRKYTKRYQKKIKGFSPEAIRLLLNQPWKGNVRELENEIERSVALADDEIIGVDAFSEKLRNVGTYMIEAKKEKKSLKSMLSHIEKSLILDALKRHNWVKKEAAKELGISRPTLDKKIAEHNLQVQTHRTR